MPGSLAMSPAIGSIAPRGSAWCGFAAAGCRSSAEAVAIYDLRLSQDVSRRFPETLGALVDVHREIGLDVSWDPRRIWSATAASSSFASSAKR
jgi:hypothetical protein